jgi:hypothetical protein
MSRRTTALGSLRAESASDFGMSGIGARLASIVTLLLACLFAGGCLVTDNAQLEPVPKSPPIVLPTNMYPIGGLILVNAKMVNEVRIPVRVRYENTLEDGLRARFRINTGSKHGAFACPDPEYVVPPNGQLIRDWDIVFGSTQLERGACSMVEFVVSTSFVSCKQHPDAFDVTTGDDDEELGRATFLIWETSNNPSTDPIASLALTNSCPKTDYSDPKTMPSPSMGTTP